MKRLVPVQALILMLALAFAAGLRADAGPESSGYAAARKKYESAKTAYAQKPGDLEAAAEFAHACADFADVARSKDQRASIANEGLAAARLVQQKAPKNPAGYFFEALNIGELAQTKTLGALPLVKEMEKSLLKALELDATIEHGGPDRSLGMLYRDAPGRPFSIGNRSKARRHLEQAMKVAPDYPDNLLSLMESELKWAEHSALSQRMDEYEKMLPKMRQKYSGEQWDQPWKDWDKRWEDLKAAAKN